MNASLGFFGGIGHTEIIIIVVVMLLVFGNRIPEVMRSLGRGVTQFKRGIRDTENEIRNELNAAAPPEDSKGKQGGKT